MVNRMKSRGCKAGEHDFETTPYRVDAGYQQAPDGTRVDGQWLRFRCRRCHHTAEQWQPEGASAPVGPPKLATGEEALAPERPSGFWERPAVIWAIIAVALALAAYGYYYDSHVRGGDTLEGPLIIKPQTSQPRPQAP